MARSPRSEQIARTPNLPTKGTAGRRPGKWNPAFAWGGTSLVREMNSPLPTGRVRGCVVRSATRHPTGSGSRHRAAIRVRPAASANRRRLDEPARANDIRLRDRVTRVHVVHVHMRPHRLLHSALLHDTRGPIRPLPPGTHPEGDDADHRQHQRDDERHLDQRKTLPPAERHQ